MTIRSRAALAVCVACLLGACRQAPPQAPNREIDFRAVGQEPGWYLEIDDGGTMHLAYDYAERTVTTRTPVPVVKDDQVSYTAATDAGQVVVMIAPRPCSDTMSGQPFPRTVTVTIQGRTLRGCGRSTDGPLR